MEFGESAGLIRFSCFCSIFNVTDMNLTEVNDSVTSIKLPSAVTSYLENNKDNEGMHTL
jgi:hypothetical protein